MTKVQRGLGRVAVTVFVASVTVLAVTGGDPITSADDEIPWLILASTWVSIVLTKPRPHRQ